MRGLVAAVVMAALSLSLVPAAEARGTREIAEDLQKGEDFRLRVSAALALGKSGDPAARSPLEKALTEDPHPMVRAAAAAALAALGDGAARTALERAAAGDAASSVKTAATAALEKLARGRSAAKAKVLIKIGKMENRTGVRGTKLATVLEGATRERARQLPGVEVLADDADPKAAAASRKLPVLVIDGTVRKLAHAASGPSLVMSAQVEYVLKKESSLKASVSGSAQAQGEVDAATDTSRLENLQDAALAGAVESALRSPDALVLAAK